MNRPNKLALIGAIIATSFINVTFAIVAKNSVLVGADLGWAELTTPKGDLYSIPDLQAAGGSGSASYSVGRFAYGAHVGYDFALTKNLLAGPELGYANNGYSRYQGQNSTGFYDSTKISSTEFNLLFHGEYLWSNGINIFIKAGGARDHQITNAVAGLITTIASPARTSDSIRAETVIGLGYELSCGLGLGVSYKRLFGNTQNNFVTSSVRGQIPYSINAVYANLNYRFSV